MMISTMQEGKDGLKSQMIVQPAIQHQKRCYCCGLVWESEDSFEMCPLWELERELLTVRGYGDD